MNEQNISPLIIIGYGGHARVLARLSEKLDFNIRGYLSPTISDHHPDNILQWLGIDESLESIDKDAVELVNGIGSTGKINKRAEKYNYAISLGFIFRSLIHPTAVIDIDTNKCGRGLLVLAGAIINSPSHIDENVLVNTGAIIEHDSSIGAHSHIACAAVVCGSCNIGKRVHIGANATINQEVHIGDGAVIASGAVVTQNVPPNTMVAGVPATHKRSF